MTLEEIKFRIKELNTFSILGSIQEDKHQLYLDFIKYVAIKDRDALGVLAREVLKAQNIVIKKTFLEKIKDKFNL